MRMKSGTAFLLAARQCEIAELEQLARTSELVSVIGRLIHALQRERGLSNVFLASGGGRAGAELRQQVAECQLLEQEVRVHLDRLDTEPQRARNGARLFSRIAVALHDLDQLRALRGAVAGLHLKPQDATAGYVTLLAALLAVVFEAADSASDPQISRALVAMFNFLQGKEFAGQERAFGARVFTSGRLAEGDAPQWRHLVESQQACFRVFTDFSSREVVAVDQASQDPRNAAEIERLRRLACASLGAGALDPELSQRWYDCCTRRMDAMKTVEELLAANLRGLCERRIADARAELRDQRAMLEALAEQASNAHPEHPAPYGHQLERGILEMVQEQARRIQAMSDELDTVRSALTERKVVERAKGLLMAHRAMTEDDAYKALRQMAMNQNRRLADVAAAVLAMADVLPPVKA